MGIYTDSVVKKSTAQASNTGATTNVIGNIASVVAGGVAMAGVGMAGAGATGGLASFGTSAVGKMAIQNMAGKIGGIGGHLLANQMIGRIDTIIDARESALAKQTDIKQATDIERVKQAKADVNTDIKESGGLSKAERKMFNTVYAKLMKGTMERDMVGRLAKSYAKQEVTNDSDK